MKKVQFWKGIQAGAGRAFGTIALAFGTKTLKKTFRALSIPTKIKTFDISICPKCAMVKDSIFQEMVFRRTSFKLKTLSAVL